MFECQSDIYIYMYIYSLVAQMKNPAMQETQVPSLSWDDPLEKRMATHSSILAWRIPWIEELAGYSPWRREDLDTTEQLTVSLFIFIYMCACVYLCTQCSLE